MHFRNELDKIRFEFHQKKPKVHKKKVDSFFRNRNLYFHNFGLINEKLRFIAGPPSWCYRVQCGTQSNASGGWPSDVPKDNRPLTNVPQTCPVPQSLRRSLRVSKKFRPNTGGALTGPDASTNPFHRSGSLCRLNQNQTQIVH